MTQAWENRLQRLSGGKSIWLVLLALWLAALIATPIAIWIWGQGTFPLMASIGVLCQLAAVITALHGAWKPVKIWLSLAAVWALGWGIEAIGSVTGFPFGNYSYTAALQPQLLGVPLLIPLAWAMMLFPAWAVSEEILSAHADRLGSAYPLVFAGLSGLAFTAWDLYLDPQMVSRGLWAWENPGAYFGIPWSNYGGWWIASALISLAVRPKRLPRRPLILIYALTWLFQAVGLGVFWGQPGPALVGFIAMWTFVGLAGRAIRQNN